MIDERARFAKAAPTVIVLVTMLLVGCMRRASEPPPGPAPAPVQEIVPAAPGGAGSATPLSSPMVLAETAEPRVTLEMSEAPVRLILQRLAEIGNLELVIPPNLNRTLSVQYVNVPVSVALKDVLSRAGLRLGSGPVANLPFDTVTVFYHLPANIDSMSVDAIVRRFGVSRAMAELIVKSRRP